MLTIGDIIRKGAKRYARHLAVADGNSALAYEELNAEANRLAHGLRALGLQKGDRVAFLAHNSVEIVKLIYADAKAGLVTVPVNPGFESAQIVRTLNYTGAKALLVGPGFAHVIACSRAECPTVRHWITTDGSIPEASTLAQLVDQQPLHEPSVAVDEGDLAVIHFTSGTTGFPKGILTTHRNALLSSWGNMVFQDIIASSTVYLHIIPLINPTTNVAVFPCHLAGGTLHLLRSFDPALIVEAIEKHRVTNCFLPPALVQSIVELPGIEQHNLASLRTMAYGAAPMPSSVLQRGLQLFGPVFVQLYGLNEVSGAVLCLRKEDHVDDGSPHHERRLRSLGKPFYVTEARVVGEHGEELPQGEVGELAFRGDTVGLGYLDLPGKTAEAFQEGWFLSGDLGFVDEDGYYFIVDRKKDAIVADGKQISTREAEDVLSSHPAVLEAAVMGVEDSAGDLVLGVVARRPGHAASEAELVQHWRKHGGLEATRLAIWFVERLPRSEIGKVPKNQLRDEYQRRSRASSS